MTSELIDRVWSIRDAVLKWLYLKAMVDGNRHPVLQADDIAKTVEWQGDPLTPLEVVEASEWLRDQEYASGTGTWGHGVVRPSITPKGEALADAGKSVRGGNTPADPQGVTTIHIGNSTDVAIESPGATEITTVTEQIKRAVAFAKAVEKVADGSSEALEHAQQIALEIKAEAAQPQPNQSRLKQLLASLVHLSSQALQDFE